MIVMGLIMAVTVGCSDSNNNVSSANNESEQGKSLGTIKNDYLYYESMELLYDDVSNGTVPVTKSTQTMENMYLVSIYDGIATFSNDTEDVLFDNIKFGISPQMQQKLDDDGVYYGKDGETLYTHYLTPMSIEVNQVVFIESPEGSMQTSCITKLEYGEIAPNKLSIEEIDEQIKNGEINHGGLFSMGYYDIIDQNTILATYNGSTETKKLHITPYIANQLKEHEDESFRVQYTEIDGKEYIIRLEKE